MKHISLLLACCLTILCVTAQSVNFETPLNWEQLKAKAKKENKLIFLDLYATWCGPCRMMDKEVYSNDTVGRYLNSKFLSAKLQVDQSEKDAESVKKNYKLAEQFKTKYKINSLPSYLFFNADGMLLHYAAGYQSAPMFVDICKVAEDPLKNLSGRTALYKKGKIQGKDLLTLAIDLKNCGQDPFALQLARKYKRIVLDKELPRAVANPDLHLVMSEFAILFKSSDKIIRYLFEHPREADSSWNRPGLSLGWTDYLIARDYIISKFFRDNKPVGTVNDFPRAQQQIAKHFDAQTAQRLVLTKKPIWYLFQNDTANFINTWYQKMDILGIDSSSLMEVNGTIYSIVFKFSTDPQVLKKAAVYMETILKGNEDNVAHIDTYAGILYKSGQVAKALEVEKQALAIAEKDGNPTLINLLKECIGKMEKGEPTW